MMSKKVNRGIIIILLKNILFKIIESKAALLVYFNAIYLEFMLSMMRCGSAKGLVLYI